MEKKALKVSAEILKSTMGTFDTEGMCWMNRKFSHPERPIRVATCFSGIGAPERALERLGLNTQIVFACDIGERYLNYTYKDLTNFTEGLDEEGKDLFAKLLYEKNRDKIENGRKKGYKKGGTKGKPFIIEEVKENLYGGVITEPKMELELVKECIHLLTKDMNPREREDYVSKLYDLKGHNYVKDSFFANHDIKEEQWHTDIRFMDATPYKGKVDLFVGGSPCQSYSRSGERLKLADTRGTLFGDFADRINECKPRVFIFENVRGIIEADSDEKSGLEVAIEVFQSIGYKVSWQVMNAKDYGVPQNRERVWVIGIREDLAADFEFKYPSPIKQLPRLYDYLDMDIFPRAGKVDKLFVRELTGTECLRLMGFHNFNIPESFYSKLKPKGLQRKLCQLAGNSMVVECLMALFLQLDITLYGKEMEDISKHIPSKTLGKMTVDELETLISKCNEMLERKVMENRLDDYAITITSGDDTCQFSQTWESIDWGLVKTPSVVPYERMSHDMEYIGANAMSSITGKTYQGAKVYSPRGYIHCIVKRHSPLILVCNEVIPAASPFEEYKELCMKKDENTTSVVDTHTIDWGLIKTPTVLPAEICPVNPDEELVYIGATKAPKKGKSASQYKRTYSVRGMSPCITKTAPVQIPVTNEAEYTHKAGDLEKPYLPPQRELAPLW